LSGRATFTVMPECPENNATLVMPEGRKIRSDSDYIFRLSGISCRLVTVPTGDNARLAGDAG